MPAGHLHVPVLQFDPANTTALMDPAYGANRDAVVRGSHDILRTGLAATF
jgi:hypothetical protein